MPRLSCLPHEPLEASYIKWDKYDPDVEIMKMDNKEKINKLQTINKKNINSNSLSVGLNGISSHIDRFKSMKNYVDTLSKREYTNYFKQTCIYCVLSNLILLYYYTYFMLSKLIYYNLFFQWIDYFTYFFSVHKIMFL